MYFCSLYHVFPIQKRLCYNTGYLKYCENSIGDNIMELKIIYEDTHILVCLKPAGIPTQTASLAGQDMVSLLKNYLAKQGTQKNPYLGVIHRLDQPVSGLLVFAKNKKAAAALSHQIQTGFANKDYLALCEGTLEEREGTLIHYLSKDAKTKLAKVTTETDKEGKKAELNYRIEKEQEGCSVVKIELQTGRFHQIRAQFSAIGHPLLGDMKYGTAESKELSQKKQIRQIALCAYRLVLQHPITGKNMEFLLHKEDIPKWY